MQFFYVYGFLLRCMECRRGLAMRNLPVRPSVWLSIGTDLDDLE